MDTQRYKAVNVRAATVYCFAISVVYAMSGAVFSTLLPSMINTYGLSLADTSLLTIFESIGSVIAMVFSMIAADRLDRKGSIIVCCLLYGAFLLWESTAPIFFLFLGLRLIVGLTDRYLDSLTAAYMSDLYEERRGRVISVMHLIYSFGMLAAPTFAATVLKRSGSWAPAYRYLGFIFLTFGGAYLIFSLVVRDPAKIKTSSAKKEKKIIPYKEMLRSKKIWALILFSFFGGSHYYLTLIPTYLESYDIQRFSIEFVSVMLTAGTVGNLVSRTTLSVFSNRLKPHRVIPVTTIVGNLLVCSAMLFCTHNRILVVVLYVCYSFLVGSNYTMKFILACSEFPEASATVISSTSLAVAAGNIVVSRLIGVVSDKFGYLASTFIHFPCMVIAALAIVWGYSEGKKTRLPDSDS